MTTATNVSVGKPAVGGAVYRGPLSATLPTSVSATLTGFVSVGYISDAGVTNSNSLKTEEIKAWGGDTVLNTLSARKDEFKFTMLESKNAEVLKTAYNDANVSGTLAEGITVNVKAEQPELKAWVIDMVMTSGTLKRIVIPKASLTDLGDIVYVDGEAVGYEVTLAAVPDANGNTHYEYIKDAS